MNWPRWTELRDRSPLKTVLRAWNSFGRGLLCLRYTERCLEVTQLSSADSLWYARLSSATLAIHLAKSRLSGVGFDSDEVGWGWRSLG